MEHDMKSMKMTKKQKEGTKAVGPVEDNPEYPYGLRINLDQESMEKLGMDTMPKMGEGMMIHAKVMITDMHESEGNKSLGLQITDMELMPEKRAKSMAENFYGDKKG